MGAVHSRLHIGVQEGVVDMRQDYFIETAGYRFGS
jgi:hypothetical protein